MSSVATAADAASHDPTASAGRPMRPALVLSASSNDTTPKRARQVSFAHSPERIQYCQRESVAQFPSPRRTEKKDIFDLAAKMTNHHSSQVSADLIWEIARNQNSYLVKRNSGGGVRFSRDPLNVTNVHSRKYAGFVNDKAVGVVPAEGEKGGVVLITKKTKHTQRPSSNYNKVTFGSNKSTRKTYSGISSNIAKTGYRGDLRAAAVSRASHIRKSQRPAKDLPEPKLRGKKAKAKAAEKET